MNKRKRIYYYTVNLTRSRTNDFIQIVYFSLNFDFIH